MDGLTIIIVVIVALLFGPRVLASLQQGGVFNNTNAVPNPNGIPASTAATGLPTSQDQATSNPVPTPAPWVNACQVAAGQTQPSSTGLGLTGQSASVLNLPANPSASGTAPTLTSNVAKPVFNVPRFFQ
jgi:hypothetical protein